MASVPFAVVTPEGKILRSGMCPESMLAVQAGPGEIVLKTNGMVDDELFYFKDGAATAYPPKPAEWMTFNFTTETWEDIRPPEKIEERNRLEVKRRRDQAIKSGIVVNGLQIATDEVSQQRIMGAAVSAMLDPQYAVQWKVTETTFVTLSAAEILQIAQLVRAHVQACFDNEATLLGLAQSGQPFDIESGWP